MAGRGFGPLVVGALLLAGACSPARSAREAGPTPLPTSITPSPTFPAGTFVRTCDSHVFGTLGRGWVDRSIVAGPVVFVELRRYERLPVARYGPLFRLHHGQARPIKVLLVVHGAEPVTLSVRSRIAALAYDPSRWGTGGPVPLSRGDRSVVFEPCGIGGRQRTQFNGAFLLTRRACVPVTVTTAEGERFDATLSFGAGRCG